MTRGCTRGGSPGPVQLTPALLFFLLAASTVTAQQEDLELDGGDLEERLAESRTNAFARRAELESAQALVESTPICWQDGHSGTPYQVEFSPDGGRVLSVATDRTVRLWDAELGVHLATLGLHSSEAVTAHFSPDGERILAFDEPAGLATLWDGRSGLHLARLGEDGDRMIAASFHPDGERVLTADDEGAVRIWTENGSTSTSPLLQERSLVHMGLTPDGSRILTSSEDGTLRLWDIDTGEIRRDIQLPVPLQSPLFEQEFFGGSSSRLVTRHADDSARIWSTTEDAQPITCPHSATLFGAVLDPAGSERLLSLDGEGVVRLWDAHTGVLIAELAEPSTPIWTATWSPRGDRIATTGSAAAGPPWLWDGRTGKLLKTLGGLDLSAQHAQPRFDPEGRFLFSQGGAWGQALAAWSVEDGSRVAFWEWGPGAITDISVAPAGGRAVVAHTTGPIKVCSIADGGEVELASHAERVAVLDVSPDGGSVVTGMLTSVRRDRHTTRIWNPATGVQQHAPTLAGASVGMTRGAAFSDDGTYLLLDLWSGNTSHVALMDLATSKLTELCSFPITETTSVLSPCGDRIAVGRWGREVVLCDETGDRIAAIPSEWAWQVEPVFRPPQGDLLATAHRHDVRLAEPSFGADVATLSGHSAPILDLEFSPDGLVLASASSDRTARLWSMETYRSPVILEHGSEVSDVAFHPDEPLIATAGLDGTTVLWNLEGDRVRTFGGHSGAVRFVAFEPRGRRLATCGDDATTRIWNVEDGDLLHELRGHTAPVHQAVFIHGGSRLLTRGLDATVRIWDPEAGELLLTRVEYNGDAWLAFAPSGHYIAGGEAVEWASVVANGGTYPLSSYASVLHGPEQVAESLAGRRVRTPSLPEAPDLRMSVAPSSVVHEREVQIEATVEDLYGVEEVILTRDGEPLPADLVQITRERVGRYELARLACRVSIPEGREQISILVRARNVRGIWSTHGSVHRRYEPPTGDLYLLAIGVADYADDRLDLASPEKDVADLVSRLRQEEGGLYRKVHARTLVGAEVTHPALNGALEDYLYEAGAEDTILVFVAGHGALSRAGRYYFLTTAATPTKPTLGIPRDQLYSLVQWEGIHARRRLLIIDTCHAGKEFGSGDRGVSVQDAFRQDEVDGLLEGSGLYIVAGSTELGAARETVGNGVFTRALLDGLAGAADARGNGDGTIDVEELIEHASAVVREAPGPQRVTRPRVVGGTPFPVARVPR